MLLLNKISFGVSMELIGEKPYKLIMLVYFVSAVGCHCFDLERETRQGDPISPFISSSCSQRFVLFNCIYIKE